MNNTYFEKGWTLAWHLMKRPGLVPAYLRNLPWWAGGPIERELPWISYGALEVLDGYVRPHHDVFEFGGGGSTIYFARRARSVVTMENHPAWHERLRRELAERQLHNVRCELHPISGDAFEVFKNDSFFQPVRARTWDVVLVDCYCGYSVGNFGQLRPYALELAMAQLNPGGLVVLDDSWMYRRLLGPRPGWRITDFMGPGPCRYGVTSTAILEKLPD